MLSNRVLPYLAKCAGLRVQPRHYHATGSQLAKVLATDGVDEVGLALMD